MAAEESNHVGQLLLTAREAAGLSRRALARYVGLDASYVYRIEVGARRPSRAAILAIAEGVRADREEISKWLMAAGYAPVPLLAIVRAAVETEHGSPRTKAKSDTPADREAARWAHWLEAMGLHELTVKRLLQAIGTVGLVQQKSS